MNKTLVFVHAFSQYTHHIERSVWHNSHTHQHHTVFNRQPSACWLYCNSLSTSPPPCTFFLATFCTDLYIGWVTPDPWGQLPSLLLFPGLCFHCCRNLLHTNLSCPASLPVSLHLIFTIVMNVVVLRASCLNLSNHLCVASLHMLHRQLVLLCRILVSCTVAKLPPQIANTWFLLSYSDTVHFVKTKSVYPDQRSSSIFTQWKDSLIGCSQPWYFSIWSGRRYLPSFCPSCLPSLYLHHSLFTLQ